MEEWVKHEAAPLLAALPLLLPLACLLACCSLAAALNIDLFPLRLNGAGLVKAMTRPPRDTLYTCASRASGMHTEGQQKHLKRSAACLAAHELLKLER